MSVKVPGKSWNATVTCKMQTPWKPRQKKCQNGSYQENPEKQIKYKKGGTKKI